MIAALDQFGLVAQAFLIHHKLMDLFQKIPWHEILGIVVFVESFRQILGRKTGWEASCLWNWVAFEVGFEGGFKVGFEVGCEVEFEVEFEVIY